MKFYHLVVLLVCLTSIQGQKEGCDPKTIDFYKAAAQSIQPYQNFDEKKVIGNKWYLARWYLPLTANVSSEEYDSAAFAYKKRGEPNKTYWDLYRRDKTKTCCMKPETGFETILGLGKYQWIFQTDNVTITGLYNNDELLMELYCFDLKDGSCSDYAIYVWSLCPEARPQDLAKAEMILKNICYPHPKRFLDGKHEMDCSKMSNVCGYEDKREEEGCGVKKNEDKDNCGTRRDTRETRGEYKERWGTRDEDKGRIEGCRNQRTMRKEEDRVGQHKENCGVRGRRDMEDVDEGEGRRERYGRRYDDDMMFRRWLEEREWRDYMTERQMRSSLRMQEECERSRMYKPFRKY